MPSAVSTTQSTHPLPAAVQTRNLLLFAGCVGMQYLAAPVLYVGSTHAALLDKLDSSNAFANSPESLYLAFTVVPVLVASLFPGIRWLKPLLAACYLLAALGTGLVAASVWLGLSSRLIGYAVVLQGILTGISIPTAITLVWEAMGRGVAESRRGITLGLAYGGGPVLAALGSLGSQALLTGESLGVRFGGPLSFPGNYALVFLAAVCPMLIAAFLATRFILPPAVEHEPAAPLLAGAADFMSDKLLPRAAIVTVLLYAGNTIMANLTLHTHDAMQSEPTRFVMYQNAMRFGTKALAGICLGALLARTNPRAGLLATGLIFTLAPLYAVFASGLAYLATFQIYGAGELVGVYAPNYLLSASRPRDLRRNMAYANLLMAPAAPLGLVFGRLADVVGAAATRATGYRASFLLCAAIMGLGLLLALVWLPKRPVPPAD
ncbi:MAG: hypothetical protein EHM42_11095 [Planctomycetaceae bacterium]|nr:MAG: hypothetical protein EHM42_11095 [Planctomycetaceae bacterium]